jgi:hypothetical protein|tara:strand:+ start:50 stop:436 length:387 start_codon:yes stop_codon:yes gene_type:complete
MQLNKDIVRNIRGKLQNLIDENTGSHMLDDYEIHVGNASFSETEVNFKLTVKVQGSKPKEELELENYLSYNPKLDNEKVVQFKGMDLKLVGFKPINRKYPFILQDMKTSKRYKFPTDWVYSQMSKEVG